MAKDDHLRRWFWPEAIALGVVLGIVVGVTLALKGSVTLERALVASAGATLFIGIPACLLRGEWSKSIVRAAALFATSFAALAIAVFGVSLAIWALFS